MYVLYQNTYESLDISTLIDVISITVTANIVLMVKITVSDIAGVGGNYVSQMHVDDALIVPDRPIPVAAGVEKFCLESRQVLVLAGETLKAKLRGLSGDTSQTVSVAIINVSPLQAEEIVDEVAGPLTAHVVDAVGELDVEVRPQQHVLGPCSKTVTAMPQAHAKTVTAMPQVVRCP